MVQLSLLESEPADLESRLHWLKGRWCARLGIERPTSEAGRITRAHFASWAGRPLTPRETSRVDAYFGGVMRRRLLDVSDGASALARKRLIAASIEVDLRSAGWGAQRAAEEALRAAGLDGLLEAV